MGPEMHSEPTLFQFMYYAATQCRIKLHFKHITVNKITDLYAPASMIFPILVILYTQFVHIVHVLATSRLEKWSNKILTVVTSTFWYLGVSGRFSDRIVKKGSISLPSNVIHTVLIHKYLYTLTLTTLSNYSGIMSTLVVSNELV